MEGKNEQTNATDTGGVRDGDRRPLLWAVVVSCVVGGVARIASNWLSGHLLGITGEQHVFIVELLIFLAPMVALFGAAQRMDLDRRGPRICFLVHCAAVLAAAIASGLLALAVLRPWLDAEAGLLTELGLMAPTSIIVLGAVLAADKFATALCDGSDPASGNSKGDG